MDLGNLHLEYGKYQRSMDAKIGYERFINSTLLTAQKRLYKQTPRMALSLVHLRRNASAAI